MLLRRIFCSLVLLSSSICTALGQQYPFIHYTPKDGLVNSRVRGMYQDSKGRLFFLTTNGLSLYDGARFTNYTIEEGLPNPMINDVIEVGPDSLLIATNTGILNAWVRGSIVKVKTVNDAPIINKFLRVANGTLY